MVSFKMKLILYKNNEVCDKFEPKAIESIYPDVVGDGAIAMCTTIYKKVLKKITDEFF